MANLDVLPKVFNASVVLLVARPLGAVHGDLAGQAHAMEGLFRKMLYAVGILLANETALAAVVEVVAHDRGGDGEEDEPVARGKARAFVEP